VRRVLAQNGPLAGCRVVVTAGGTQEAIDPVRYLSNRSSGKQGYALAQAAVDAGAEVRLISTVNGLPVPVGATHVPVRSAVEMQDAVLAALDTTDALVMAAAVSDYRPETVAAQKIKKAAQGDTLTLELERNPDILLAVKARRSEIGWPRVVVGFAAESENLVANAQDKVSSKGLDLLAANDISAHDAGFGSDDNRITILDAQGNQQALDLMSKAAASEILIARMAALLGRGAV
jgi:phosphopantothenoylcysteine decarboxylase/phosphopantothenate--cysteine ligase